MFDDIKAYVKRSALADENKQLIIRLLDDYAIRRNKIDPTQLSAEDTRIKNLIMGAVSAYQDEIDQNKLSTMLADTFKKTGQDFGEIAQNVKTAVNFFTNPAVIILVVVIIIGVILYVKVLK